MTKWRWTKGGVDMARIDRPLLSGVVNSFM